MIWRKTDLRRWATVFAGVAIIGVFVVGFHPFVIQTWRTGTVKFLETHDPTGGFGLGSAGNLEDTSGPWQLVYSIFSRTTNSVPGRAQLRPPMMVSKTEIYWMGAPDVRVGGFGPFFSGALVGAVILFCCAIWANQRSQNRKNLYTGFLLAAAALTIAVFLFPTPSVARYVPHIWAVPLLFLAAVEPVVRLNRGMTIVICAVGLLCAVNSAVAFSGNFARTVFQNRDFYELAWRLDAEPIPVVIVPTQFDVDFYLTLRHRLENRASSIEIRETYDCENVLYVFHRYAKVCG